MKKTSLAILTLGALGVVYGDIGTSPLYALNEVFFGSGNMVQTPEHIAGVASLIFWMLLGIIGIKYATFVLRADHEGEGGAFALLGLLKNYSDRHITFIGFLLMFAAGLLFGEGIITPAISVLSAVEGLKVITPAFEPWVVPLTIIILFGIFFVQRHGSSRMGTVYGPVMFLWFCVIGGLGAWQVYLHPSILLASINPLSALATVSSLSVSGMAFLLGAVFLVLTGSEALYADLGHFGKRAIRVGWFGIVFPALILNYAGQSAYLLHGGNVRSDNIFYSIVPEMFLVPMIVLATCATIVASVALIFGAYSLVSQAVALKLLPRFRVVHTNEDTEGQIYIPAINWSLCIGSILLVLMFGSATRLASAYGFAVSGVMVVTSIAMFVLSRRHWKWRGWYSLVVFGTFIGIDLIFFLANSLKFFEGGFIPFSLGLAIFSIIVTWRWGRQVTQSAYVTYTADRDMTWFIDFKRRLREAGGMLQEPNRARKSVELDRAAVFVISRSITALSDRIPVKLRVYIKRRGAVPKNIILLHIEQERVPFVTRHYEVMDMGENVFSVRAVFGFMENPNAARVLRDLYRRHLFEEKFRRCSIEVSEDEFFVDPDVVWHIKFRILLFKKLLEMSVPAYRYFGLYAEASTGLSKTVVPIRISRKGIRVEIPEFPMAKHDDLIDPDTLEPTNIRFTNV